MVKKKMGKKQTSASDGSIKLIMKRHLGVVKEGVDRDEFMVLEKRVTALEKLKPTARASR